MKKEFVKPELRDLSVNLTNDIEYVDYCNWVGKNLLSTRIGYGVISIIDGIQKIMVQMIQQ